MSSTFSAYFLNYLFHLYHQLKDILYTYRYKRVLERMSREHCASSPFLSRPFASPGSIRIPISLEFHAGLMSSLVICIIFWQPLGSIFEREHGWLGRRSWITFSTDLLVLPQRACWSFYENFMTRPSWWDGSFDLLVIPLRSVRVIIFDLG